MNVYTVRNHTLRAALLLISGGFVGIQQANASELNLSTEFHASAEQAVAGIRDELKIQFGQSIQPLFPTEESLVADAMDMDEVMKQMPVDSGDGLAQLEQ